MDATASTTDRGAYRTQFDDDAFVCGDTTDARVADDVYAKG